MLPQVPLGPLRQFRAEQPVLLENFAVMNHETTHEPDTHASLERSLIHRLGVRSQHIVDTRCSQHIVDISARCSQHIVDT
jgi:hypothetical protein